MAIAGQNFSSALKEEDEIKFQCDTLKHEYLNNNHIMKCHKLINILSKFFKINNTLSGCSNQNVTA